LVVLVAVQLSVLGLYLPPVTGSGVNIEPSVPPHTIISLPLQTAVCALRGKGALVVLMAVQLLELGLYFPPPTPFQTIISLPVQTAV
jgi:hypothetical protein